MGVAADNTKCGEVKAVTLNAGGGELRSDNKGLRLSLVPSEQGRRSQHNRQHNEKTELLQTGWRWCRGRALSQINLLDHLRLSGECHRMLLFQVV